MPVILSGAVAVSVMRAFASNSKRSNRRVVSHQRRIPLNCPVRKINVNPPCCFVLLTGPLFVWWQSW